MEIQRKTIVKRKEMHFFGEMPETREVKLKSTMKVNNTKPDSKNA
jgi:hypothetical protein